jgi:hypothetical protein
VGLGDPLGVGIGESVTSKCAQMRLQLEIGMPSWGECCCVCGIC